MPDLAHKHARLMLILFKPWRHAQSLRGGGETWEEAYLKFRSGRADSILEAIDSIHILRECEDSRDAHFSSRQNRKWAGLNRDMIQQAGANEDAIYAEEDESLVLDHEHIAQTRSNHLTIAAAKIADSIFAAEISGMFDVQEALTDSNEEAGGVSHTLVEEAKPMTEHVWSKSYQARKDKRKKISF